ncbi:MAG: hypothetical protein ABI345_08165 [Jatrophihabitans sp.]
MLWTIVAAMAQIDAADKGDVQLRTAGMSQHDEFLVMRTSWAYPHIEQAFPSSGLDLLAEMPVLLLAEG